MRSIEISEWQLYTTQTVVVTSVVSTYGDDLFADVEHQNDDSNLQHRNADNGIVVSGQNDDDERNVVTEDDPILTRINKSPVLSITHPVRRDYD